MATDFPRRDSLLLPYAQNFSTVLTSAPTTYGATAGIATTLAGLVTAFDTAYTAAIDPLTRTRATIATKNTARGLMLADMRSIARVAQGTQTITDAQLIAIGLTPRATPSPINPPADAPILEVVSVFGKTAKLRLHGVGTDRRGKPVGCASASVFSYVGTTPPADMAGWVWQGSVTRTIFDVSFPAATPAGSQVFLTAMWLSPRGMPGPACAPISTYLAGGVTLSEAA